MKATERAKAKRRSGVRFAPKPLPAPEAVYCQPKAVTGLFASLTETQRAALLSFSGSDTYGSDLAFCLAKT
jgi:hypothetical protein